ncbi:right-handed parallel beta-helix repeat-containing protein [Polyangium aurulentum]|uniref:right-handed parallel beta-helix repeat-containing protein n=1 Tax=Polyangium aurulentum TaxID=2567896 RepID=UPI0010ADACEE|nr:right-handed parallel beta-helix repeat-containing protein [Polyangium aurulentum]UQA55232.1 right-handed parallel beta-helix repeat-containing protein [Polyangium aurulentum]
MTIARSLFIVGGLGLALSACSVDEPFDPSCTSVGYPTGPEDAKGIVHVSATSGSATGDGSEQRPFASIQQGIDAAPAGGAVLVMPGTYKENLRIDKPVQVLGTEASCPSSTANIILQSTEPRAIEIKGANGVVLRGLHIEKPLGAGIVVSGGEARVESSIIEGAVANGEEGFGLLATDDASIILQNNAISGSALGGVVVRGAKGIILQSEILDGKGQGGIVLERASGPVTIEKTLVARNQQAGIAVLSSKAIILQSEVMDTIGTGGSSRAEGIVVAELVEGGVSMGTADAQIEGNTISGNDRTGVVFAGNTRGIILQNNLVGNGDNTAFGAGIWLQGGAGADSGGIRIEGNTLGENHFVGIGVTSGSRAIILQKNNISGTLGDTWMNEAGIAVSLGDGIGVFKDARVEITGNDIERNARAGIVLDAASAESVVRENMLTENGIILQNMPDIDLSTNHVDEVEGPVIMDHPLMAVATPQGDMAF